MDLSLLAAESAHIIPLVGSRPTVCNKTYCKAEIVQILNRTCKMVVENEFLSEIHIKWQKGARSQMCDTKLLSAKSKQSIFCCSFGQLAQGGQARQRLKRPSGTKLLFLNCSQAPGIRQHYHSRTERDYWLEEGRK